MSDIERKRRAENVSAIPDQEEIVHIYDYISGVFFNERLKRQSHFESFVWPVFKSYLGDIDGKRVLDLGCGPGVVANKLHEMGAKISGIDISFAMVKIAQRNFLHNGSDPHYSRFYRAEATNLPFVSESMDMVVASYVLNHMGQDNLLRTMREAHRVLRPGGRLVIMDPHPERNQKYYEAGGGTEPKFPSGWYKEGWPELGDELIPVYYRHIEDWLDASQESNFSRIAIFNPTSKNHQIDGLPESLRNHYATNRILVLDLVK